MRGKKIKGKCNVMVKSTLNWYKGKKKEGNVQ